MIHYKSGINFAKEQDQKDPLAHYRDKFHIPKTEKGENWLYFTGNSLGLQPKQTKYHIQASSSSRIFWTNKRRSPNAQHSAAHGAACCCVLLAKPNRN